MNDRTGMEDLKLNAELAADVGGERLRILQDRLQSARAECRSVLDRGHAPAEAARLKALMDAYGLGADLLAQIWRARRSSASA